MPNVNSQPIKGLHLEQLTRLLALQPFWAGYVGELREWLLARKAALNLNVE